MSYLADRNLTSTIPHIFIFLTSSSCMSPMPVYHCSSSYANGLLTLLGLRHTGASSIISTLGLRAGSLLSLTYWTVILLCYAPHGFLTPALCSPLQCKEFLPSWIPPNDLQNEIFGKERRKGQTKEEREINRYHNQALKANIQETNYSPMIVLWNFGEQDTFNGCL